MIATLDRRMARNDQAVKIDSEVVKHAKIVATHRGITVAEYLSEKLRDPVAADYRESLRQMASEIPAARPPQPGPADGGKGRRGGKP